MKARPLYTIASVLIPLSTIALAQGPLTPPGAPAPTMKSLQEIWDKIDTLETTVETQQAQIISLQKDQAIVMSLLLENQGATLPWALSTVDSTGNVGQCTSLTFTPAGQPAISYYDGSNNDLKYAVFNGSTWTLSTVDSIGNVGSYSSLAFTPGGQPAISYYDATNLDLKYAAFNGTTWTLNAVDSTGSVGTYTSLAFTPSGQPSISYYDSSNGDLKFAVRKPFVTP